MCRSAAMPHLRFRACPTTGPSSDMRVPHSMSATRLSGSPDGTVLRFAECSFVQWSTCSRNTFVPPVGEAESHDLIGRYGGGHKERSAMTRTRILTVLFTTLVVLGGVAPVASAHYRPGTGRWLERDPIAEPVRLGERASDELVPPSGSRALSWMEREPSVLDRMPGGRGRTYPLYEYGFSAPSNYSDPTGLVPIGWYYHVRNQWECCKCLVYGEAGGESDACMEAVAWVLRNRQGSGWGAHRKETDFCKQAHMPKTFEAGYPHQRYKNCQACTGNALERAAMDRAGKMCIAMINGLTDPTGGAQYWYTKGRSPGFLTRNPKCRLVTIPNCDLDFWVCTKEPLASDPLRPK